MQSTPRGRRTEGVVRTGMHVDVGEADVAELKAGRIRILYWEAWVQGSGAKEKELRDRWPAAREHRASARAR